MLAETHQFYFAFENSLCNEYVTEKFFNAMLVDMIPVVMNGANMSKIAPPNSYIDVKNFDSIKGNSFCVLTVKPMLLISRPGELFTKSFF